VVSLAVPIIEYHRASADILSDEMVFQSSAGQMLGDCENGVV